jgi:hypothetical protein
VYESSAMRNSSVTVVEPPLHPRHPKPVPLTCLLSSSQTASDSTVRQSASATSVGLYNEMMYLHPRAPLGLADDANGAFKPVEAILTSISR